MLIRKAQTSKKVRLNVDSVSYWIATNNAKDNQLKRDYFARYGVAEGVRQLAEEHPFPPKQYATDRKPVASTTTISNRKGAVA
jgi:type IV secretion system protein VirB4